jgi:hypothetical protein
MGLVRVTDGTSPIVWEILGLCSGFDVFIGISLTLIVFINITNVTSVLGHFFLLWLL